MIYNRERQNEIVSEDIILTLCKQEKDFNRYAKMVLFKKNQNIFTELNSEGKIYFLVAGTMMMNLSFQEEAQQELILKFLSENTFFSPDSFKEIDDSIKVKAKSLTSGACWEINFSFLQKVVRQAGIENEFHSKQLSKFLQMTLDHLAKSTLSKEARIRSSIAQIGRELGREDEFGQITLPPKITQPIIAKFSTATREFVALTLGRLVDEGILKVRPKPWIINDINRL